MISVMARIDIGDGAVMRAEDVFYGRPYAKEEIPNETEEKMKC